MVRRWQEKLLVAHLLLQHEVDLIETMKTAYVFTLLVASAAAFNAPFATRAVGKKAPAKKAPVKKAVKKAAPTTRVSRSM